VVTVEDAPDAKNHSDWRPTKCMELVSRAVENFGPLSGRGIRFRVSLRPQTVLRATDLLVEGEYLRREPGPSNSVMHHFLRAFKAEGA
jgi:hypothetical protein